MGPIEKELREVRYFTVLQVIMFSSEGAFRVLSDAAKRLDVEMFSILEYAADVWSEAIEAAAILKL